MMEVREESKLGGKGAADVHASSLSTDLQGDKLSGPIDKISEPLHAPPASANSVTGNRSTHRES